MFSTVVMVPPDGFAFNNETAASNTFQNSTIISKSNEKALDEFQQMVATLRSQGIEVLLLKQSNQLPDAVFPNNWFSTHSDSSGAKTLIIYPMLTQNRQAEVNISGLCTLLSNSGHNVQNLIDLREGSNEVLEGTGSMVMDKNNRIIYACLSPRTSASLVTRVGELLDYRVQLFDSVDAQNRPIYHTNVMMSVAQNYVIICLESITDEPQRARIVDSINRSNKELIEISLAQMNHMCGNVLELFNAQQQSLLILSTQAKEYFAPTQLRQIENHSKLIAVHIPTIETVGGGSARCMLAEIDF